MRREELAAERERAAIRRAALSTHGGDLTDAERLLVVDDEEADEAQVQAAAGPCVLGGRSCLGRCRGLIPEFSDVVS
ncbi:hypothetical protein PH213_43420 [Streptomyces sp. SRF1]|uniref:hypothetical protein n=1 Tax=Streptomyces sp. SRF1 TaxID=1549642 RepID=UPI0025B059E3|nr:hypothetical protein [Streptomyces sp. SRF1]MDN3061227.1 hypothetical protein [Streptomyces sp. SRF1]